MSEQDTQVTAPIMPFMERVRKTLVLRKMKKSKIRTLIEAQYDLRFYQAVKWDGGEKLQHLRNDLATEQNKGDKKDPKKVQELSLKIAELENTRMHFDKMQKVVEELRVYIDMIDTFIDEIWAV